MTNKVKKLVIERAKGHCEYCLSRMDYSPGPFSIEHIIPLIEGGDDDLNNLPLSCQGCNNIKYIALNAVDPVSQTIAPLYHPRQHTWSDHFRWSQDYLLIEGLSPTGRATINRLKINRLPLINLRCAMIFAGDHPPV